MDNPSLSCTQVDNSVVVQYNLAHMNKQLVHSIRDKLNFAHMVMEYKDLKVHAQL